MPGNDLEQSGRCFKRKRPLELPPRKNGPLAYAYRMAGYIRDVRYIRDMTRREFGERGLLSTETIEVMQAHHASRKAGQDLRRRRS